MFKLLKVITQTATMPALAVLGLASLANLAQAQDSGALIEALVRKGVLSDQEAEEIRADLTRDFAANNINVTPGGKSTKQLRLSGRVQTQFDGLSTDASGAGADPAAINRFQLRRVYLGVDAKLAEDWAGSFHYNFANNTIDKAFVQWTGGELFGQDLSIDAGLRKVNLGYEETTSSARLKAIERSVATRYFVESNNTRRLGAGSRHIGVFADLNPDSRSGKTPGLYAGLALTNPDRQDNNSATNSTNNTLAGWADVGYYFKINADTNLKAGAALGYLPDQGDVLGVDGNDTTVGSFYADFNFKRFNLAGEALLAQVENVAAGADDHSVFGYWIQPSFKATEKLEFVARYSFVDTDGRGLRLSDVVPAASSLGSAAVTRDQVEEFYFGANYYFLGTDVKLSAGYVFAQTDGSIDAASTRDEEVRGIRSQLQVLF
jgi:phosphate-selective porin